MENKYEIVRILEKTKEFFQIPENNFLWSKWGSSQEAINELDKIIKNIESENHSIKAQIEILFAPTGSIQEVSISGGWGREFIEFSREMDEELKKIQ